MGNLPRGLGFDIVTGMKTRTRATTGLILGSVVLLALPAAARAQKAVFVVRHAEKISDTDERLSDAGRARAVLLAQMLKSSGVAAVYATDTERARDTVNPLADALGLRVAIYDTGGGPGVPVDARPFVEKLRREHGGDVVVIAGHTNTIPDLLKALGCADAISIAAGEYDNLFVVVPKKDGSATLVRLRY
jgi:broad specificity phosphatase PhoE